MYFESYKINGIHMSFYLDCKINLHMIEWAAPINIQHVDHGHLQAERALGKHSHWVSNLINDLFKWGELLCDVKQGGKFEYFHRNSSPESPQVTKKQDTRYKFMREKNIYCVLHFNPDNLLFYNCWDIL